MLFKCFSFHKEVYMRTFANRGNKRFGRGFRRGRGEFRDSNIEMKNFEPNESISGEQLGYRFRNRRNIGFGRFFKNNNEICYWDMDKTEKITYLENKKQYIEDEIKKIKEGL